MSRRIFALAVGCLFLSIVSGPAGARPEHKQTLAKRYGRWLAAERIDCRICHVIAAGEDPELAIDMPPHNAFGRRLAALEEEWAAAGRSAVLVDRLEAIADEDADGDGVPNELELLMGRAPGEAEPAPSDDERANGEAVLERFRGEYAWRPLEPIRRPPLPPTGFAPDELPSSQEHGELREAGQDPTSRGQADHGSNGSDETATHAALSDQAAPAISAPADNPIDAFIESALDQQGLSLASPAAPEVLLRRVYLDLIGLPPTREALHAFLQDRSPDAYLRVVEQLLASPQYGERWGRHWMDIWRYSDWAGWSDGGQIRDSQPHIWRWRDWIVESLNEDKGYDRMVLEMLAADELAPSDSDALRATGYLARNYKRLSREIWMQDVVNHTAQAFVGMTVGCARCHDHMYDPISQQEYYQLRAIFEPHQVRIDPLPGQLNSSADGLARAYDADVDVPTYLYVRGDDRQPDKEHPLAPAVPAAWGGELQIEPIEFSPEAYYPGLRPEMIDAMLADAREKLDTASQNVAKLETGDPTPQLAVARAARHAAEANWSSLNARIAAERAKYLDPEADPNEVSRLAAAAALAQRHAELARAELEQIEATQAHQQTIAEAQSDDRKSQEIKKAEERLSKANEALEAARKAVADPGSEYDPLSPIYPTTSSGRRLAFARWIVHRDNPLAARVAVNHIWQRHFRQALVGSTFDFGNNGQQPTHPALLDWLAAEFIEPRWSLVQQADGTAAWQELSKPSAAPWSMKHIHHLIVTSKTYRRSSRAEADLLERDPENRYLGRMPPRRMEAELVRDAVLFVAGRIDLTLGGPDLDQNKGDEIPRRSLYFRHAHEKQMLLLKLFDAADVSECYVRKQSVVPQQALALMNGRLALENARALARKLDQQAGRLADAEFILVAFETVLSRSPRDAEISACRQFLQEQERLLAETAIEEARGDRSPSDGSPDALKHPASDPVLRARENLVHVLMNHNDFVTIR